MDEKVMRSLAIFIFPGVQTLDLFGPVEMLGGFLNDIKVIFVAETDQPVLTRHGQTIVPDRTFADGTSYDLLLIPGGDSALDAAKRQSVLNWITAASEQAEQVMTVCTGSILLGITGVLDGYRATTNKMDFTSTIGLAPNVNWVAQARWVHDGKFFTSSGVSAGMDMALAAGAHLFGEAAADEVARGCEYDWHKDPSWDPFAEIEGLV